MANKRFRYVFFITFMGIVVYYLIKKRTFEFSDGQIVTIWRESADTILVVPGHYWGLGKPNRSYIQCTFGTFLNLYKVDSLETKLWIRDGGNYVTESTPIIINVNELEIIEIESTEEIALFFYNQNKDKTKEDLAIRPGARALFIDLNDFFSYTTEQEDI